jgi:hypothetical protein
VIHEVGRPASALRTNKGSVARDRSRYPVRLPSVGLSSKDVSQIRRTIGSKVKQTDSFHSSPRQHSRWE